MCETERVRKRHLFCWTEEARDLVKDYRVRTSKRHGQNEAGRRMLVTRLAEISGNPRDACIRFLCRLGVTHKRRYCEWTKPEQQRLLDLITTIPVEEAAKILDRPSASVRSMLHRLGIGGRTGREWFTKFSLSRVLQPRRPRDFILRTHRALMAGRECRSSREA
jgi:hypothetical protein